MSSDNSSLTESDSPPESDDRIELIIAIIALVISIIALVISALQALQQYFSSAIGYSSCSNTVVGKWAAFTHRHFTPFRLEVRFRVPVLFVAPPKNRKGPLGETAPIHYINGTPESYEITHTWNRDEFDNRKHESIRTTDNELATWNALLMAIQRMEKESRTWQEQIFGYKPPVPHDSNHTIAVGVQEKTRSWDTMPDGLLRPYATSTIGHFIEMMAMLGIYWKEFDRNNNIYRAQGNGFSVSGSLVPNLGIGFTFEKVGKTWFESNRIVPNNAVKELCFGFCPTIFQRDMPLYTDEPKDKGTLQLGTRVEVAETLVSFGCNTNTVNYFRYGNDHTRYSHLFPLLFEMLGMVGAVFQIKQTAFTMLPNPTFLSWDKSAFSLPQLLIFLGEALNDIKGGDRPQIKNIIRNIACVQQAEGENTRQKRTVKTQTIVNCKTFTTSDGLVAGSNAIATGTNSTWRPSTWIQVKRKGSIFTSRVSTVEGNNAQQHTPTFHGGKTPPLPLYFDSLHSALEMCDEFLTKKHIFPCVSHVFCLHLQEVLKYLNSHENKDRSASGPHISSAGRYDISSDSTSGLHSQQVGDSHVNSYGYIPLERLDSATSSERHHLLARLYVHFIRQRIMTIRLPPIELDLHNAQDDIDDPPQTQTDTDESASHSAESVATPSLYQPTDGDVSDIWCTLVFRMLCWLMLHDFHKKDIQVSKSDVFDSRLPVYIL